MWKSIINVIIKTANKIINKQGKSVMLDFFANCSDLCCRPTGYRQLTNRLPTGFFASFSNDKGLSLDDKTKYYVDRNTGDQVESLHEVTQLG